MTMLKLWEIADGLDELAEQIIAAGGEVTPEIEAQLDAMEGAFEEKVERVALFIRECEVNKAAAAVEEDRLAAIRHGFERKAEGLKSYLLAAMKKTGQTKVQTPRVKVREQRNGQPAIRYAGDPLALDCRWVVTRAETVLDKATIKQAWEAGEDLPPGVVVEVGTHIRIS